MGLFKKLFGSGFDPREVAYRLERGEAYLAMLDHDRAAQEFAAALQLDANTTQLHLFWRGQRLGERGDGDGEIAVYDMLLRLDPQYALGYAARGNALRLKRDHPRAIADLTEAIRLDANHSAFYFNRGLVHGEAGNYRPAIADFTAAIRLNPNDPAFYVNRGEVHGQLGMKVAL